MKKDKYDLIFGLGYNCACSIVLRKNRLQKQSYPFDWIGKMDFLDRIDTICHHFKDFMHPEDFKPSGYSFEEKGMRLTEYINQRNQLIFRHDFPSDLPYEQAYQIVEKRYQRRIERLLEEIQKAKRILIVCIEGVHDNPHLENEVLKTSWEHLNQAFPNKEWAIRYYSQDFNQAKGQKKITQILPTVQRIEMNYEADNEYKDFWVVNEPLFHQELKHIRLNQPLKSWLFEQMIYGIASLIIFRAFRRKFCRHFHLYG